MVFQSSKLMSILSNWVTAIAYEVCKKEAHFSKIDFEHHVYHLIVHSVLHLLGYEHEEEKKAAEMEN